MTRIAFLSAPHVWRLAANPAHALECDKATLASSKVLCSDPDLKALADERQRVWFETWKHLDPRQRNALTYDQSQWVKTYPDRCGVTGNLAPALPISVETKRCFTEAGRARIEYIKRFGTLEVGTPIEGAPGKSPLVTATAPEQRSTEPRSAAGPATRAFILCLGGAVPNASIYHSDDGGQSAILLAAGTCKSTFEGYHDECMAAGQSDGDCTVNAVVLAQAALKLHGR